MAQSKASRTTKDRDRRRLVSWLVEHSGKTRAEVMAMSTEEREALASSIARSGDDGALRDNGVTDDTHMVALAPLTCLGVKTSYDSAEERFNHTVSFDMPKCEYGRGMMVLNVTTPERDSGFVPGVSYTMGIGHVSG